ncbi:hypothetical protein RhiXN_08520 [Rhizoctonia solani]|uniref:Uncharacterized protein n=1 Tax=Rhizoctonia solani TaxID=456999 RepID=A0A8H8SZJ0_9AGAM|nr:uncharacterized protein RhiXN_08520 [Rhizoctonia solani]QRW23484.1 hypothetical protein RhiXN_08520 [Rhizoctonia solani]
MLGTRRKGLALVYYRKTAHKSCHRHLIPPCHFENSIHTLWHPTPILLSSQLLQLLFVATNSQLPSCSTSPTLQDLPGIEPELSLSALLQAIQALTTQVGSLQDQVKSQGKQIIQLVAICRETNNLVGNKDQGGAQTKPGH